MTDQPAAFGSRTGALASVPGADNRRSVPVPAQLKFFYGPMDCGKSTLALQIDHNQARQGRHGMLLTRYDRSGRPEITTRVGLSHEAVEVGELTDIRRLVQHQWASTGPIDYVIVDEAGFLSSEHVDQLAELVDEWHVDVYCFGLATDFRSQLLPGAKRLVELADELVPVHVEVLCWCGRPGRLNARVVDERVVRAGNTVVVADTDTTGTGPDAVRYQVLCRAHYRHGDLGPSRSQRGQLRLDV